MFGFFGRKKKYRVNGRILVVENRSKLSKRHFQKITFIILEFFEKEILLFKFKRLHIVLHDSAHLDINPNNIKRLMEKNEILTANAIQPDIIRIDLSYLVYLEIKMPFEKYSDSLLKQRLKQLIIHEAYHLLHFDRNSAVHQFKRKYEPHVMEEIQRILESIDKPFESTFAESIKRFRTGITNFLGKIWIEGLAEFLEGLYNGRLIFDKDNFVQLYSKAEANMRRIENTFASFRDALPKKATASNEAIMNKCLQLMDKLMSYIAVYGSYNIGEHIFYAIRYLDPEIDDKLMMKLHIYKLILLYEKLMLKHGHQPVISLYSGSGLFDYKRAIKFLAVDLRGIIKF